MRTMKLRLIVLGVSLALVSQAPAQQSAPPLKIGVETRLVLVDLVVVDNRDKVVSGLKQQDFVVREDGRERPIVSFTAFTRNGPLVDATVDSPGPGAPLIPKAALSAGAHTVLFVDDQQLTPQDAARLLPALKKLVDVMAEQQSVLMLVAPGSDVGLVDDPAKNRAGFREAIDQIVGRRVPDRSDLPVSDAEALLADQGDSAIIDRLASRYVYLNPGANSGQNQMYRFEMAKGMARARATDVAIAARSRREGAYRLLSGSLNWLGTRPGRRSIVMVSGGYAADKEDRSMREIVNRSLRANAPIHFLDARGLQGMSRFLGAEYREALEHDGMEAPLAFSEESSGAASLAADTGGLYVRNTSDMEKGLSRIVDMTATYYVLGYEPPESKGKSGFRKIKVEVAKKGLTVTARRGYFDEGAPLAEPPRGR
jgi:VWFA-related protein